MKRATYGEIESSNIFPEKNDETNLVKIISSC